jgi:putative nucleotidyltransferase with HDIG domain
VKNVVSKARSKKTRTREKQAGKGAADAVPFRDRPSVGILIAVCFWACSVLILRTEALVQRQTDPSFVLPLVGDATFLLISLIATGLFLKIVRPDFLRRNSHLLLLCLISLISLLLARSLRYFAVTTELIPFGTMQFLLPFAMAPLLATILVDGTVGLAAGVWTSFALALLWGGSFPLFLTGLIATVVTGQTARRVRTRAHVFRAGLIIGLSETAVILGITATNWSSTDTMLVLHQITACVASGFLSAVVVLLILPLFETSFRITTDITLLELSDLGHPLLQRLALEAPGTYHHSLIVASLAQAAADEINANSLLSRVCAYFHDAGKLTKPEFFSENMRLQNNPHDTLPPSMSTLVITSHVKEGLSLAMLHKLPDPVLNVIREHHGTSLLSYFHHKAKTQLEFELAGPDASQTNGQGKVSESDFRYPGPRPSSRESAIICLADAVEAASRSMEKTTPGHIKNLVTDIVNTRLEDSQLDECDLSLADLSRVKRSFIFTLTNMLHGRVPYPKDENRDKQPAKGAPPEQAENKKTDTVPDGTNRTV